MVSTDESTDLRGDDAVVFQSKRLGLYGLADVEIKRMAGWGLQFVVCPSIPTFVNELKNGEGNMDAYLDFRGFKSYILPLSWTTHALSSPVTH